jgi:hypothetical protein
VDSPRRSVLTEKRWPGSVVMASLSKWKRMAAVLLGDFPAVVKGKTGAVRHDGAPRLGARCSAIERRWRAGREKAAARVWPKIWPSGFFI